MVVCPGALDPWNQRARLLARAGLRRFLDDRAGAELDLAEVEEVAERSGMRLLECDARLERARLVLASGDASSVRMHTDVARSIITEAGYHRRDRELAALDTALSRGTELGGRRSGDPVLSGNSIEGDLL